ncbi:DUF262 domain-containing HNH endonuclease family protein [Nocardioides sp.]|uniref:DUF262 domain-containing protein n=1 Tax=Nocardioides sp. TaxID=35761 RepID=UPI002734BF8D|nr:DUF262 domain-containing HNH endonuclease family protein [Nocardioides sp.]MDP3890560.1 DUF262 domain-containing HNH endonuclease family protein [Nocardioides sp.]
MSKLDTDHGPFVDLISQGRVYSVPEYQRPYSWTPKKQVAELWSDIHRLYLHRVDDDQSFTHFIGSVVIGAAATKALGPVECPVIDGQQRLITLSLIVAAIRDELVADEADQNEITGQYLAHIKRGKISAPRVRPGESDRKVFEEIVTDEEPSDTRSKVYKAYTYLCDRLALGPWLDEDPDEADEDGSPDGNLDDNGLAIDSGDEDSEYEEDGEGLDGAVGSWDWEVLIEVVGTQLELVSIADVPAESAYQIFATLNSKGMPLSQVDLTRNAVFMLMPTQGKKAHKDFWMPMEQTLGRDSLQSYLHTWVIRSGHNVPAKEIYSSAMRELSKPGFKEADVRKALRGLHTSAWSYKLISSPASKDRETFYRGKTVPKSVVIAMERLKTWGTRPMEPVLVELFERYRLDRLTTAEVTRMLSYLESFVVRRYMAVTPPNDLRSTFARLTQQISSKTQAKSFENALVAGLQEPLRRWPTDHELLEHLKTRPLYRKGAQRQTSFVLRRMAEHLEGKEYPHIAFGTASTDYSIEHILPQTLSKQWQTDLTKWGDPSPVQTRDSRLDVIGNLTVTAYNSELSNKSFDEKKKDIAKSLRLEISKGVLSQEQWTREEIDSRSQELWKAAVRIWPRA